MEELFTGGETDRLEESYCLKGVGTERGPPSAGGAIALPNDEGVNDRLDFVRCG